MATDIIARGMITEYKSGTNIDFKENEDGSVTISASGDVSSEDTVARETIDNHKLDKNNPHNVTAEQVGLGNVDNTSDLDKPISTAIQTALDDKADKTTATKDSNGLMSAADKAKLDGIEENANHTVIDSELSDTSENAIQNRAVAKAVKGGNSLSGSSSYTITDSVEYPIVGLKVYGKSTQDGTPTAENPVDIVSVENPTVTVCGKNLFDYKKLSNKVSNGVTFTNNNDGSFTVSGNKTDITKQSLSTLNLSHEESLNVISSPGTYTISGVSKDFGRGIAFYLNFYYDGKSYNAFLSTAINIANTVTQNMFTEDFRIDIGFYSYPNYECGNGTFFPQIEKGSIATKFEPYKANTLTFSDTLNAIPVSSGGNITIDGQGYIADYKDYGTGKYHKLIDPNKLDPTVSIVDNLDLQLASEEITDIPETEMQAYRQLQTYNGTTNISNDKGAGLSVKYCTNKALSACVAPITTGLQRQIDELKAAVLSLGGNV